MLCKYPSQSQCKFCITTARQICELDEQPKPVDGVCPPHWFFDGSCRHCGIREPKLDESTEERGLYGKYIIEKASGKPLAPNFYAIVLRIDGGRYVDACRNGALAFATAVRNENEPLAHDIYQKVYELIREEVRREEKRAKAQLEADQLHEQERVEDTEFRILEYFRHYARQLELKYPNPSTEEQGWLGNIWDMIKLAGKGEWRALWEKEEL